MSLSCFPKREGKPVTFYKVIIRNSKGEHKTYVFNTREESYGFSMRMAARGTSILRITDFVEYH